MKLNFFLKSIPFISTFLLIVFLNISNQKINTKLRILIWNTPSFSVGTYLAISTGAGFMFSYILTTSLVSINNKRSVKSIQYKEEISEENYNEYTATNFKNSNEKTLIERNLNDPLPTMNAQFRVIGKTERYNKNYVDNYNIKDENSFDYEKPFYEKSGTNDTSNQKMEVTSDWNDDSYTRW